jgi:hypothetical protein
MPKKPSDDGPERQGEGNGGEVVAPSLPPPVLPSTEANAAPPEPKAAARTRTQRNRRLVWLSAAFATLIGAIWTALAGSMVENGRNYFSAKLEELQGVTEIKRLRDENDRLVQEHNAVLTQKQTEYDKLLADGSFGRLGYVTMAFRDQRFCMDEVRRWAEEKKYPYMLEGEAGSFSAVVTYFNQDLQMRCVGGLSANTTYLVIGGTVASLDEVRYAYNDLSDRFANYMFYPSAITPDSRRWVNAGPFVELGYITFELRYADYKLWENSGRFPQAMANALMRPSTAQKSTADKGFWFFIVNEPGRSVTIRSPEIGKFALLAADGNWQPNQQVLAAGTAPADDTPVRIAVLVSIAALTYGRETLNSPELRYLGDDAKAAIAGIPGVVNGGAMDLVIRNW